MTRSEGANRRLRREHNEQMSIAYVASSLVMAKQRPPLKQLLVSEDAGPKRRKSWQEMKASIVLAFGLGKDDQDG